jgi:hypothetical protein
LAPAVDSSFGDPAAEGEAVAAGVGGGLGEGGGAVRAPAGGCAVVGTGMVPPRMEALSETGFLAYARRAATVRCLSCVVPAPVAGDPRVPD